MERYGVDLAAWWQARRWRGLLDLIDQLPASSRLNEAVQNDPEQALLIALRREHGGSPEDAPEPWSPRVSEYDLHAIQMRELIQAVGMVHAALVRRAKVPELFPAPRTEVDRQVDRIAHSVAVSIITRYGFDESDI